MGLFKFLKGIFGAKETETCPTPEEVKVPAVKAVEIKKEVVKEETFNLKALPPKSKQIEKEEVKEETKAS